MIGRTTRTTVNPVSTFLGEDQTRTRDITAADLAGADPAEWRRLRAELEERRQRRLERRRFRRDPEGYLNDLETKLNQSGLPA